MYGENHIIEKIGKGYENFENHLLYAKPVKFIMFFLKWF